MNNIIRIIISIFSWNVLSIAASQLPTATPLLWIFLLVAILLANMKLIAKGEPVTTSNAFCFFFIPLNYHFNWLPVVSHHPACCCYFLFSIVAIISLILKKPFTMILSGRNLPKEKINSPLFYSINKVITVLWTCIFAINGLLNLLFSWTPQLRIVSIMLLLSALIASKYLPAFIRRQMVVK